MYNFIGIDVSKLTLQIYIPHNDSNIEIHNDERSLDKFYKELKKLYNNTHPFVFIYEPTANYGAMLTKFCAKKDIHTYIVNPYVSANFSKSLGNRNKTDISDAHMLYNMHVMIKSKDITVPVINHIVESIRELVSYYRFLQKQKVSFKNHLEAAIANDSSKYIISDLKKNISRIQKQQQNLIAKAKTIIKQDDNLQRSFENITSIKGIGDLVGILLLHLFLNYPQANRKQITALVGLDPIVVESGTSVKKRSRISKRGLKMYRGLIFYSILSTVRFNEKLKIYYEHLKSRNKHSTTAQIAVMRKLVLLAHSLYKNNTQYDPEYYKINSLRELNHTVA